MENQICDVINCNQIAIECHAGEIYFCAEHYKGAVAAIRAGLDVERAMIYKWEQ